MGKSRKKQKNGKINGAKARHVRNAIERAAIERGQRDLAAGSDEDFEPPARQERKFHNNSSMCFGGYVRKDRKLWKYIKLGEFS